MLALALAAVPSSAQSDDRISPDGTVRMDGVKVPLSDMMSEEGREYLRHLIVDKPFGTAVPDITEERMRTLDEVRDLVLADWRADQQADTAAATARALVDGADADSALADLEELSGYSATATETLSRADQPQTPGTDFPRPSSTSA